MCWGCYIRPNRYPITNEYISRTGSLRHSHAIQYALDHFGYEHDDIVALLDGDIFAIKPIDLRELLEGYDVIGSHKVDWNVWYYNDPYWEDYLWVTFIAFDPRTIPNKKDFHFMPDFINNRLHDTGSHSYFYLKNNPDVAVKKFDVHEFRGGEEALQHKLRCLGMSDLEIGIVANLDPDLKMQLQLDSRLLHSIRSSFERDLGHQRKMAYLKSCMRKIIESHN